MADFESLNHLEPQLKILIVKGQTLVDETRKRVKERRLEVDLTGRLELKSECADVEKVIKKIRKGKTDQKTVDELELAMIRLQTVADGLMKR